MFGKEDKQSSALPLGQVPKIMASGAARPSSLLIVAFKISYASSISYKCYSSIDSRSY